MIFLKLRFHLALPRLNYLGAITDVSPIFMGFSSIRKPDIKKKEKKNKICKRKK